MLNDFNCMCPVYIICGYIDLRQEIDGLAESAQIQFLRSLFLFCGRQRGRLRALHWEGDGFCCISQTVRSSIRRCSGPDFRGICTRTDILDTTIFQRVPWMIAAFPKSLFNILKNVDWRGIFRQTKPIFAGILCAFQEKLEKYDDKRPVQWRFERC